MSAISVATKTASMTTRASTTATSRATFIARLPQARDYGHRP
jgi:hypothetical protein